MIDRVLIEKIEFVFKDLAGAQKLETIFFNRESSENRVTAAVVWGGEAYKVLRYNLPGRKVEFKKIFDDKVFGNEKDFFSYYKEEFSLFCLLSVEHGTIEKCRLEFYLHKCPELPGTRLNWIEQSTSWCRPEELRFYTKSEVKPVCEDRQRLEASLDGKITGIFAYVENPIKFDCVDKILKTYYGTRCSSKAGCVTVNGKENVKTWLKYDPNCEINKKSLGEFWKKESSKMGQSKVIGFMYKHDRNPSSANAFINDGGNFSL